MIRTSIFRMFVFAALLALGSLAAAAQSAPVAGKVLLKKADGTIVPVAGALVDVYRIDVKGSMPTAKTDKRGEFRFAGFPPGDYALSISAEGAEPGYIPDVKPGQTDLSITLNEGDGKRPTEAEARTVLAQAKSTAGPTTRELTKEEKEAQAEYEKKVAEVEARNKKIKDESTIINAALQAASKAFDAKNYDLAIEQYNIGIAANPDYFGSASILLNNRGVVLKTRGVIAYNRATGMSEGPAKDEAVAKARKDLLDAKTGYERSYELLKSAPASEITDKAIHEQAIYDSLSGLTDTYRLLVQTKSLTAVDDEMNATYEAYGAVERDPAKKVAAYLILGEAQGITGDSDKALATYQKVLEMSPDNPDALRGAGLSLVNIAYLTEEKNKFQEAVDYLQKFLAMAPENHRFRGEVSELIDTLKKEQNVTPQKKPATKRKN